MNIIDLTEGAYPGLIEWSKSYEARYAGRRWIAAAFSSDFRLSANTLHPNIDELIDSVPIFLVNRDLSNKFVEIPGYNSKIRVPNYEMLVPSGVSNIEKWKESKKDPKKKLILDPKIIVLLGLYAHSKNYKNIPRRIFVWIDNIQDYAEKYIKTKQNCIFKLDEIAKDLFDFVLTHERGHALMDVELYGEKPSPRFSYGKDYIYFFIEEAYANAYALTKTTKNLKAIKIINGSPVSFIEDFVTAQKDGYSKGLDWYKQGCYNYSQWMIIKRKSKKLIEFESKIDLLVEFWKTKDFSVLSKINSVT